LESEQLSGAALDVFATEPLRPQHPFWRHPRIVVTPHDACDVSLKAVSATLLATADAVQPAGNRRTRRPLARLLNPVMLIHRLDCERITALLARASVPELNTCPRRNTFAISSARLSMTAKEIAMDAQPNSPDARDRKYQLHAYTDARRHQDVAR